jgi:hypothetical protein
VKYQLMNLETAHKRTSAKRLEMVLPVNAASNCDLTADKQMSKNKNMIMCIVIADFNALVDAPKLRVTNVDR